MRIQSCGVALTMLASVAAGGCKAASGNPAAASLAPGGGDGAPGVVMSLAGSGHTLTSRTNGEFAQVDGYIVSPDGLSYEFTFIFVSRDGDGSAGTTNLNYGAARCTVDPSDGTATCSDELGGSGNIPNTDFQGGPGRMSLHTNTATIPGFFVIDGVGGEIDVDWRPNGLNTFKTTGTSESSSPTFSTHFSGTSESRSAVATGRLIDRPLIPDPSNTQIGTSNQTQVFHTIH